MIISRTFKIALLPLKSSTLKKAKKTLNSMTRIDIPIMDEILKAESKERINQANFKETSLLN